MSTLMTEEETQKVLELHAKGVQQKEIAKMFNRSTSGIHYLIRKRKNIIIQPGNYTEFSKLPDDILFHHTRDYSY